MTKIRSQSSCQHCGAALRLATSGRRKRFCSDARRQAAFRNEMAGLPSSTEEEISAHEVTENKWQFLSRNEDFALPRSSARSSKQLKFEKQNSVTYKLTDGQQTNTGGGRASRALGYVMEVSTGRWVARVRNLGSDLLPFGAAKKEAIKLHRSCGGGTSDWINELNLRTAAEIDGAALEGKRRKAPLDLLGCGNPWLNLMHVNVEIIRNIVEVESFKPLREEDMQQQTVKSDDYPIKDDPRRVSRTSNLR
jgi:hypothetical protein